jgi:hypothetical protein
MRYHLRENPAEGLKKKNKQTKFSADKIEKRMF